MKARIALLVSLAALVVAPSAEARWGPQQNCSLATHCYGITERGANNLASIAFEDTTLANVPEWASGAFVTNEEWISFAGRSTEWVEDGQIIGAYRDCCTVHPFFAEYLRGGWHETIGEGPMPPNNYNHYVIFDPEQNGAWHVYWECCLVGVYGGGWPARFQEEEAGIEVSSNTAPTEQGRQMVAVSDGGTWYPWTGARIYRDPGIAISGNGDNNAAGNISWTVAPGINYSTTSEGTTTTTTTTTEKPLTSKQVVNKYAKTAESTPTVESTTGPTGSVTTIRASGFRVPSPTPHGVAPPKGKILTLVQNAKGFVTDVWLTETPPTAAQLKGEEGL